MILTNRVRVPHEEPLQPGDIVTLSDEVKAQVHALIDALSDVTDHTVTPKDLSAALRSLRERDGIVVELDNDDHLSKLIVRLVEMKDSAT